jgi:phosphoribosylaminoimidazolecarboxamide formyltransferase/IMP cyclohydrolase
LKIQRALISVSDKTGIVEFSKALATNSIEILSTGGTAQMLRDAGIAVTEVADHTGFPEMLDGRVKTLHPSIHGGLLARREVSQHMQAIEQHQIAPIDLLVVNLYPFEQTVAKPDCSLEDAIENIDIGGPAMVRSAAKNWRGVGVVTANQQYNKVLEQIQTTGGLDDTTRFELSVDAFGRIADYDAAIAQYLSTVKPESIAQDNVERLDYPTRTFSRFEKVMDLRYGENPHQNAAYYRDVYPAPGAIVTGDQVQGKALSYNNIADADAAWECVKSFDTTACVIVKHANPCGVAVADSCVSAYQKAFATDPTSAFGGIIAFNRTVDGATAAAVSEQFVEVLMAPDFDSDALKTFESKPNVRLLKISLDGVDPNGSSAFDQGRNAREIKRIGSGILIQGADNHVLTRADLNVVTERKPSEQQIVDLLFAWTVAKYVKSNAIVFCADGATVGVGAGQMSRLDSARIAAIKAEAAGLDLKGSVAASDAFFPFRDGLDVLAKSGATAIIQPGGSMRDEEVIAAANEHDIAMVLTGVRHFRH